MRHKQFIVYLLGLVAMLVVTRYVAELLAPRLHLSHGVALIGTMVVLYLALSFVSSRLQIRQQNDELAQLAAKGLDAASLDELRAARQRNTAEARKAVRMGLVWVNLPLLPIMLGPMALARYVFAARNNWVLGASLVFGFVAAWGWWSVNVSLWRRWAVRRGVDAAELQQRATEASLVWPRGHFLERTELDSMLSRWKGSRR
jgi:amino acid transporter